MSNLNTVNVEAGIITASGLVTTSGGIELPSYDTNTRPDNYDNGTLIWNKTDGAINIRSSGSWLNISGGGVQTWTDATRPSAPPVGTFGFNTDSDNVEVYDGTDWLALSQASASGATGRGSSASNPASSAQEVLLTGGDSVSDGLYYIDTPNGGVQQIYCIFDNGVGWMVVGKFASDASNTVANTITTTRGLTVQDSTGTEFSADFGDYNPAFQRFIGCNNISQWANTRNLDWWYGVPSNRLWKNFWTNGRSSGMDNQRRYGFTVSGNWDGYGRWANPDMSFYQMSDGQTSIDQSDFTSSGSFYLDNASDAKFGADAFSNTPGQDESVMVQFGRDDSRRAFMDTFPNRDGNNTNRRDYSTAVYCLLH